MSPPARRGPGGGRGLEDDRLASTIEDEGTSEPPGIEDLDRRIREAPPVLPPEVEARVLAVLDDPASCAVACGVLMRLGLGARHELAGGAAQLNDLTLRAVRRGLDRPDTLLRAYAKDARRLADRADELADLFEDWKRARCRALATREPEECAS